MKCIKAIFGSFLLLVGCQNPTNEHIAIGTWTNCSKAGVYREYKITDNYMLMLNSESDEIWLFKTKILDDKLILSEFKDGLGLMINNDTLVAIENSKNKIILKSTYTWDKLVLNKAKLNFTKIDSTNMESWKKQTLAEFKKRAESVNCPDLRTESEKEIPTLNINIPEEEKIPIRKTEK